MDNVKIGIVTDIRVTHLSIGMTNQSWEDNRVFFSEKFKENLPLDITNNGICETFIFCHDQNIILDYENSGKFKNLKKYRYVFLGNGDTDKIENNSNIIVARNLPHNIEEYPNINAYTGWYALWKNNLITTPYVNLFEYDVILNPNLEQTMDKFMYDGQKMIGYIPFPCTNYHFIDNKDWVEELFNAIKQVYKIDLEKTIRLYIKQNPKLAWSTTSNCTMEVSFFNNYITTDWSLESDWNSENNTPGSIAFRFKTNGLPTSNIPYSQSLWSISGPSGQAAIVLTYTGSGYVTSSLISSSADPISPYYQYARLDFIPRLASPATSASVYLPFFDGGWWSVLLCQGEPAVDNADIYVKNSIYNGYDGNQIGFQASSSCTFNAASQLIWNNATISFFGTSSRTGYNIFQAHSKKSDIIILV